MAKSSAVEPPVETLLHHPEIWRAGRLEDRHGNEGSTLATGYPSLDALLAGGGWPRAGLIELLSSRFGIGELRLLAPVLARLSHEEPRWVLWLAPPHIPYAPALTALGIETRKMLLVHPRQHRDALWALEQALRSGTCSTALAWFDDRQLKNAEIRRLKLAAREGGTCTVLFRSEAAARETSMAELRLKLRAQADGLRPEGLEIDIVKRRGGWPTTITLPLPSPLPVDRTDLDGYLALWRRHWSHRRSAVSATAGRDRPMPRSRPAIAPTGAARPHSHQPH
jgi:hypothetical protein